VVGRPARQPPGRVGSAGAPRLFLLPCGGIQWGEVSAMGRGEAAEKLSPEEDLRTSTKGRLSHAGISPRATMRQGVNQPCGIRGSWGCGPALPSVVTRARRRQPRRVQRDLEDGGGGAWRGAGPLRPPHVAAAAALAWGIYNPAPAAGGGGGGGGGGPRRGQGPDGAWQGGRELQVADRTGAA